MQKHDFKDIDEWECIRKTREDFNKRLHYVSQQYGFEYIKDKKVSIKCVNGHLAQENGDMAHNCEETHLLITGDDGKAWFEIDTSFEREEEYRHPKHHIDDKIVIGRHLNAFRDNPKSMTLPEIEKNYVNALNLVHKYAEAIELHLDVEERKLSTEQKTQETLDKIDDTLKKFVSALSNKKLNDLDILKQSIKSKEDVLKYSEQIKKLTTEEKYKLTEWIINTFE
jgi:hypothetical protein